MLAVALIPLVLLVADPADPVVPTATGPLAAQPVDVVGLDVDELRQAERDAQLELTLQQIRLGLLKAWARVAESNHAEAAQVARQTLTLVANLPESVDRTPLVKSLERVLKHAVRAREKDAAPGQTDTAPEGAAAAPTPPARRPADPSATNPGSSNHAAASAAYAYPPEPMDLEPHADPFLAETLERLGEDPLLLKNLIAYPSDWQELTARRARFKDGTIFKGPKFRDANGQLKQTIIYDVRTLLMGPSRFPHAPQLDQLILSLDSMGRVVTPYVVVAPHAAAFGYTVQPVPTLTFPNAPPHPNGPTPEELAEQRLAELERLVQEVLEEN